MEELKLGNKTIFEVELLELLPANIRRDPDIIAASKSIDFGFLALVDETKKITMLPRISEMKADTLDHLAYFFHVDFYDQTLPIETKRRIIKDSVYLHQIKGTPLAVELLIEAVFPHGKLEEWFEYGSDPYKFKVTTTDRMTEEQIINNLFTAIDTVKNKRSWLELLAIERQKDLANHIGIASAQDNRVQINPFFMPEEQNSNENIYVGTATNQVNIITIYSEEV